MSVYVWGRRWSLSGEQAPLLLGDGLRLRISGATRSRVANIDLACSGGPFPIVLQLADVASVALVSACRTIRWGRESRPPLGGPHRQEEGCDWTR